MIIHTRIHAKYHMTYDTLLIGVLYLPVYNDTPIYAYVTVFNFFNIIRDKFLLPKRIQ